MNSADHTVRRTLLEGLEDDSTNEFCELSVLNNEASVETFFVSRLIPALGYSDSQIKTKQSLDFLALGRGRRREQYKPDYALMYRGIPRCIVDAKATNENLDNWIEQCSGYCLALNRKYKDDPVRFFILTNGLNTVVYEWNKENPIITLEFSDFCWGNPIYEELKRIIGSKFIDTSLKSRSGVEMNRFPFSRITTSRARKLFSSCHNSIWKSEGYGPGPAFFAFVKLMFVKLWADRKLRTASATKNLFLNDSSKIMLPEHAVTFSVRWIEQRYEDGSENPINEMFIQLRKMIEKDIRNRKKKRIFSADEDLGLGPDTILEVVKKIENVDLFGIDEDLNGRLFETFLNAAMRGRELGQFFTPRSIVKMMTELADLQVTRDHQDRVIDGCCGSGGFLIEALTDMRNKVRRNGSMSTREKENLIDRIANECIYGIDFGKDPPLARISRINMYLHGDGGSRIYRADGLDKDPNIEGIENPEIAQNVQELRDSFTNHRFDVILTNPPFSMKKEIKNPSDKRILEHYDMAKDKSLKRKTNKLRPSLRSSVMFLERYHDILRNGGRLITVIDETLLSSCQFGYVRDFIRDRFLVRAIISLPGNAFKMSESRVKTSVLVLEKKADPQDQQGDWYFFFSEHMGMDDLNTKASDEDVRDARRRADNEAQRIVSGFRHYLDGDKASNVLGPDRIMDRLDLRNCVPMLGRMVQRWNGDGVPVRRLEEVMKQVTNNIVRPSNHPDEEFKLINVTYDGKCEINSLLKGNRIRPKLMRQVTTGQIVFSKNRATDGAIGIVPQNMHESLVSISSYTVFDCDSPQDAAYLWSVLRSHELRADMQSLSPGAGRYTTHWRDVRQLQVPWPHSETRRRVGNDLIELWDRERELMADFRRAMAHLDNLGVESQESRDRWRKSRAPQ